ncbi:MAG: hypothetical protein V1707_02320 [bacterium]
MKQTMVATRQVLTGLKSQELRRLFGLTSELNDLLEDVLEEKGMYRKEFLQGLWRSAREAKIGKVTKVRRIADLR